jgi:hypothetical protein
MKIIIYKICCNKTNRCYIGSTTTKLNRRINKHKSDYKLFIEGKQNNKCSSIEILRENDYQIIILEEIEVLTLEELNERYKIERKYIESNLNSVNKIIPSRTEKEYYQINREVKLQRQNDYYKDPIKREKIKKYNLERYYKLKELLSSQ